MACPFVDASLTSDVGSLNDTNKMTLILMKTVRIDSEMTTNTTRDVEPSVATAASLEASSIYGSGSSSSTVISIGVSFGYMFLVRSLND